MVMDHFHRFQEPSQPTRANVWLPQVVLRGTVGNKRHLQPSKAMTLSLFLIIVRCTPSVLGELVGKVDVEVQQETEDPAKGTCDFTTCCAALFEKSHVPLEPPLPCLHPHRADSIAMSEGKSKARESDGLGARASTTGPKPQQGRQRHRSEGLPRERTTKKTRTTRTATASW